MLAMDRAAGAIQDAMFRDLPGVLRAGDLLVLNDSRVLPARLFGRRAGASGVIEVLLAEEVEAMVWRALLKPAKKVRVGERLEFYGAAGVEENPGLKPLVSDEALPRPEGRCYSGEAVLKAEVVGAGEFGERTLRFEAVADFYGVVGRIGHMPLPPYIRHGKDEAEDRERYQTVYAREAGSAAAPTAGLHFTPEVLAELKARGVEVAFLTLHVGLGTFQPVRVSELKDIRLHSERYTLPEPTAEALNRALAEGRRVVAVGTTTTRVLEHIGKANHRDHGEEERTQRGTEATTDDVAMPRFEAHSGATSIFIGPGHRFRVVSGLLTNFHLPESTLLMLVSAFAGREWVLAAYAHAVREGYRFYSYGDCMLVL
jgi:S-adenosylmethionine:tRNA ribosyltransferase-isomerase